MPQKQCFKCKGIKDLTDFYHHKKMLDGYLNKCKECVKTDVIENRNKKIEYYREYDRNRGNLTKRIAARIAYAKTKNGKNKIRKAKEKWKLMNKIKRGANIILGNAIRNGRILKGLHCETCRITGKRIHGHHDDYAFPLSVRWLCSKCHIAWHREHGEGRNG